MLTPILKIYCILYLQSSFTSLVNCDENGTLVAPQITLANGGVIAGVAGFSRSHRACDGYFGIPYATVPERFQEAKPITAPSWEGVFNATQEGPACPQATKYSSEDCLSLSVMVPRLKNNATNGPEVSLPVMVWIHGGHFFLTGAARFYRPHFLMSEDIILVTFNYRLGIFGFLSTGDKIIPGNAGLKDMVLALKWIQENIKQFGGDPTKVTIFGESTGGASVHYLMLSSTSQGLFQRAISQSGTALNLWAFQPDPKPLAVKVSSYFNCATETGNATLITSEEILKCLKEIPVSDMIEAQRKIRPMLPNIPIHCFLPTAEPSERVSPLTPFISESPITLLSKQETKLPEIPWIVGANEDEASAMHAGVILSNPKLLQTLNEKWDEAAPYSLDYGRFVSKEGQDKVSKKLREFYFGDKNITEETRVGVRNVFSDGLFLHGIVRSAKEVASRGPSHPVYLYQYAYKGSRSDLARFLKIHGEESTKVGHNDEVQQLFLRLGPPVPAKPNEEEFSKDFVRLWTSFAIHGEPSHSWGKDADKKWLPIQLGADDANLKWYRIQPDPVLMDVDGTVKDRMKIWDGVWNDTILPAMTHTAT